jgi:hypothetical protein
MPLKSGSSRATISTNIKELTHSYERSGKIGNNHPANKGKAVKQAVAIALDKASVGYGSKGRSKARPSHTGNRSKSR